MFVSNHMLKRASLLLTILVPLSCSDNVPTLEGTYAGTFTVHYEFMVQNGPVTMTLKGGRYSCSGNTGHIPAGGSGTYTVSSGVITFKDENIWTADFDWNLILNGPYQFTLNSGKLTLSKGINGMGTYTYELNK